MNQRILPAVSDFKSLEKFVETDLEYCVVLNFTLIQLNQVSKRIREKHKKCIVHMDLINGIASNEDGAAFIIEAFHVEGLISTHPSVIDMAKKKHVLGIQRIFIIDSRSLRKSIQIAKKCQPDYIELLPGHSFEVKGIIDKELTIPLIGGGLISNEEMVEKCLNEGLVAVTTSSVQLWEYPFLDKNV